MAEESSIEFARVLADTEARLAAVLADFKSAAARQLRVRESRERKLQEDRRKFEVEKAQAADFNAQADDRVRLNVGGHRFETTRKTLCAFPSSMLAAWFSGRHVLKTTPDGEVFIDRNGQYFGAILDYCRTKQPPPLPADEDEREALWREFDFFCLPVPGRVPQSPIYDIFSGGYELVNMSYPSPTFQGTRFCSAFTSTHACAIFQEDDGWAIATWDTTSGQLYPQIHINVSGREDGTPLALEYPYVSAATSLDLNSLAVWDVPSGKKQWEVDVPFIIDYVSGLVMMDGVVVAVGIFPPYESINDAIQFGMRPMGIPMCAWRAETGEIVWEATCTAVLECMYTLGRDRKVLISDGNKFVVYDVASGKHVFTGLSSMPSVNIIGWCTHVHFEGDVMHLVSEDNNKTDIPVEQRGAPGFYTPKHYIRASTWDMSHETEMQNVRVLPESGVMIQAMGENRNHFELHTTQPPYNVMWYLHDNHISCIRWTPTGNTNTFHKQTLYIPRPEDNAEHGVEVFSGLEVFDNVLYFFGVGSDTSPGASPGDRVERLVALKPVRQVVA